MKKIILSLYLLFAFPAITTLLTGCYLYEGAATSYYQSTDYYEYDDLDRLIDEKWYKGERLLIREFNCFYESGKGHYRVIEKNQYGEIVFQDIVTSKSSHIQIKGK